MQLALVRGRSPPHGGRSLDGIAEINTGGDNGNRTRTFSVTGKRRYQLTLSPLKIG